jgi:P27 family predicted phage terminase small subunit
MSKRESVLFSMKNSDRPKPPAHLGKEAKRWWRELTTEYVFDVPDTVLTLQTALESFDRQREARETIAREGAIVKDRFGFPKVHPATLIERDAKMSMLRALRQLGLDVLQPNAIGRPPGR